MHSTYTPTRDLLTIWLRSMPRDQWRRRVQGIDVYPGVRIYYVQWPDKPPKGFKYRPGHPCAKTMDLVAIRVQPFSAVEPGAQGHGDGMMDPAGALLELRRWLFCFAYDASQFQGGEQPTDQRELGRLEGRRELASELLKRVQAQSVRDAVREVAGDPYEPDEQAIQPGPGLKLTE